jgi:chromosome segregation ATPase
MMMKQNMYEESEKESANAAARLLAAQDDVSRLKDSSVEYETMVERLEVQIAEMKAVHKEKIAAKQAKFAGKDRIIDDLRQQLDGYRTEASTLRAEIVVLVERLEEGILKTTCCEETIEGLSKQVSDSTKTIVKLNAEVAAGAETVAELTANLKAAATDAADQETRIAEFETKLGAKHRAVVEHAEMIEMLEQSLEHAADEMGNRAETLSKLEDELEAMKASSLSAAEDHAEQLSGLEAQHAEAINDVDRAKEDVDILQSKLKGAASALATATADLNTVAAKEAGSATQIATMKSELEHAAAETEELEANIAEARATEALRVDTISSLEHQLEQAEAGVADLAELKASFQQAINEATSIEETCKDEIGSLKSELAEATATAASRANQIEVLQEAADTASVEASATITQLEGSLQTSIALSKSRAATIDGLEADLEQATTDAASYAEALANVTSDAVNSNEELAALKADASGRALEIDELKTSSATRSETLVALKRGEMPSSPTPTSPQQPSTPSTPPQTPERLVSMYNALKARYEKVQGKNAASKQTLAAMQLEFKKALHDAAERAQTIAALEVQLQAAKAAAVDASSSMDVQVLDLQGQLDEATAAASDQSERIAALHARKGALERELSSAASGFDEAKASADQWESTCDGLTKHRDALLQRMAAMEAHYAAETIETKLVLEVEQEAKGGAKTSEWEDKCAVVEEQLETKEEKVAELEKLLRDSLVLTDDLETTIEQQAKQIKMRLQELEQAEEAASHERHQAATTVRQWTVRTSGLQKELKVSQALCKQLEAKVKAQAAKQQDLGPELLRAREERDELVVRLRALGSVAKSKSAPAMIGGDGNSSVLGTPAPKGGRSRGGYDVDCAVDVDGSEPSGPGTPLFKLQQALSDSSLKLQSKETELEELRAQVAATPTSAVRGGGAVGSPRSMMIGGLSPMQFGLRNSPLASPQGMTDEKRLSFMVDMCSAWKL